MATLLAVIFFIVALALPWYGIAERGTYSLPGSNTTSEGDLISSFYWTGFVIYINPSKYSVSEDFHLFFIISCPLRFLGGLGGHQHFFHD